MLTFGQLHVFVHLNRIVLLEKSEPTGTFKTIVAGRIPFTAYLIYHRETKC
jgi:hypothetical protein